MPGPTNPRLARTPARLAPDPASAEAGGFPVVAEEIAFLAGSGASREILAAVTARARRQGASPEDVLIREGHCSADLFYRSLAAVMGLPFASEFDVLRTPPNMVLARCELAHVQAAGGIDYVVAPRGPQIVNLLASGGRGVADMHRVGITTPGRLTRAILVNAGMTVAQRAADAPVGEDAGWSARTYPTTAQKVGLGGLAASVAGLCWMAEDVAWLATTLALTACFVLQALLRIAALVSGRDATLVIRPRALPDHLLPVYTVLVPLYREGRVLGDLVTALQKLDYPPAKLEIKLLVEEYDGETRRMALGLDLQPPFEVVVCPAGQPRTKPRALNVGLALARDGLLVVYDAEDRPDPDQLRLAAAQFAASPDAVACLQASLAIDNGDENWLTRHFAIEYAQLFDVVMPGLARLGLPIPLGGTSNHFRIEVLREAGAWDAWNVTEDADLGLRLARLGYRVGRLESTTWEEAPIAVRPWLRQRTRWLKGWLQTSLVHGLRRSAEQDRAGGIRLAVIFAHTFGLVLSFLSWPFFSCAVAWHIATGALLSPGSDLQAIAAVLELSVALIGAAIILWPWATGAAMRRLPLRLVDAVLLPAYLLLGSWAGWCALVEFLHAPFHWAKTEHGLARRRVERRRAPLGPRG